MNSFQVQILIYFLVHMHPEPDTLETIFIYIHIASDPKLQELI